MGDFEQQLTEIMVKIHQGNGATPHTLASLRTKGVALCSGTDACADGVVVGVDPPGLPEYNFRCKGGSEGADLDDGSTLYHTRFLLV